MGVKQLQARERLDVWSGECGFNEFGEILSVVGDMIGELNMELGFEDKLQSGGP